jgi:hypothetical protein
MGARKTDRWTEFFRVTLVVGSLMVSLCILMLGLLIFWNQLWHVPRLVYAVLPTYVIKDQNVNGLLVENRGHAPAHKVLIRVVDLDQSFQTYTIKTSEQITAKEGDEHNIAIWLDRIVPGSSVTLFIPTDQAVTLENHLAISAEEGRAVPASSQQKMDSALVFGLVALIGIFLLITGGTIGWALARAYKR